MVLNDLSVTFIPTEVLKHSKKSKPWDKFEYIAYEDKTLCVIAFLKKNIFRRNKHEGLTTDQLIITLRKPFERAFIDRIRRIISSQWIILLIFFNCYLAAPQPTLGHHWGDSLTHPMLITAFLCFWTESCWKPCNEVGSLSLAKCLVGFKLGTFWLYFQCLDPQDHSPHSCFSPHSCWVASSSKANCIDVIINEIIRRGCWKNPKMTEK